MFIHIKRDVFRKDFIASIHFNDAERAVFIHFQQAPSIIFGPERSQSVPSQRVITEAEYNTLKDYFRINLKAEVVI